MAKNRRIKRRQKNTKRKNNKRNRSHAKKMSNRLSLNLKGGSGCSAPTSATNNCASQGIDVSQ